MGKIRLPNGRIYDEDSGKVYSEEAIQPAPQEKPEGQPFDWARLGGEFLGGIMGGTAAGPATGGLGTLAGVGLGAEAGGQIVDLSRQYLGGQQPKGGLLDRTTDAAKNVMLNMAGEKIGGQAINALGRGAQTLLEPARRRLFGGDANGLLSAYQNAGVQPSAGLLSGNRFLQGTEETLARIPGSQGIMRDHQNQFYSQLSGYADNVARTGGIIPMGETSTSGTLAKAAKESAERFRTRWNQLDDAIEQKIGSTTPVEPKNAADLLDDMEARYTKDPKALAYLKKPIDYLKGIVYQNLPEDAAEDMLGEVSFGALRKARTHIGKSLEQPTVSGYVGDEGGQFRAIYSALTKDIEDAAKAAGPDAYKAFETANRYARTNLSARMPALEDITARADVAYKWLMAGSRDTGSRIRVMRQNLTPTQWDEVVGTTIEKLGKANPSAQNYQGDVFSPETFLTSWNKMSKDAKTAMFGGKRYTELRGELDNLGKIVDSIRDTRYMKNPSGTAYQNVFTQLFTDPVAAVSGIALMGIPQNQVAKYMTDPRFVRWVARGARINPVNENAIVAHLARMPVVAAGQQLQEEDM